MKLSNRVLNINNRRTSIRFYCKEWEAIDYICNKEHLKRNQLISMIEKGKNQNIGLSYSTRLFALLYYQSIASNHKADINKLIKDISEE